MQIHRRVATLIVLTSLALLLAACGGGGAGTGPAATQAPAAQATSAPAATQAPVARATTAPAPTQAAGGSTEQTELLIWDQFTDDAAAVDAILADFMAEHPNITVKREGMETGQMRDILRTAIDAGEGPDVIFYDTGPGFAGVLARSGLLLPLDEAYEQYGWNERILPVAKQRTVFDGKAYGIGHQLEAVGVFYNKRIFEEQGLQVPTTHEELLAACDKLSAAGIYPIAFGDSEKWTAGHTFSVFAGNIAGRDKLAQAISGEASWSDPEFVAAIDIPFVQMRERNCFNPDITAINYDDMNALFTGGQAAMNLTGTWMVGDFSDPEVMPDPVGFFFYPSVDGKPIAAPAGLGSGYFVTRLAENPEAAYELLDFLFSPEVAQRWLTEVASIPPVEVDTSGLEVSELMTLTLQELQTNGDKMGYNIDVLTPENFNNMMFDGFQEVLTGTKTAEQQAADLQAEMEKAKAENKVIDITE